MKGSEYERRVKKEVYLTTNSGTRPAVPTETEMKARERHVPYRNDQNDFVNQRMNKTDIGTRLGQVNGSQLVVRGLVSSGIKIFLYIIYRITYIFENKK